MEIDHENIVHVYPINDTEEHLLKCEDHLLGPPVCRCKCNPRHELVPPAGLVVVHDAFDGRTGVEWAKEILKQ